MISRISGLHIYAHLQCYGSVTICDLQQAHHNVMLVSTFHELYLKFATTNHGNYVPHADTIAMRRLSTAHDLLEQT